MTAAWRMRVNYDRREQLAQDAWARDEVGLWYGGWTPDDLARAEASADFRQSLNASPGQRWELNARHAAIVRRFCQAPEGDWVVVCFSSSIHLARLAGPVQTSAVHPLNRGPELFHFRRITNQRSFLLADLPDSFRLIQSAGQDTIHGFKGCAGLVELLVESESLDELLKRIGEMSLWSYMDMLGPTGWESFCLGYLVVMDAFVPAGLLVGGTLADVDIVGRSLKDGAHILAQCKKDVRAVAVKPAFLTAHSTLHPGDRAYYFAYGGCRGTIPEGIRVVGRVQIERELAMNADLQRFCALFKP